MFGESIPRNTFQLESLESGIGSVLTQYFETKFESASTSDPLPKNPFCASLSMAVPDTRSEIALGVILDQEAMNLLGSKLGADLGWADPDEILCALCGLISRGIGEVAGDVSLVATGGIDLTRSPAQLQRFLLPFFEQRALTFRALGVSLTVVIGQKNNNTEF